MYVPRAMYSLRMSFWIVPLRVLRARMPRSSATTMYIASSVAAVALIVIDVDTLSSGMPSSSACMSSTVSIATPTRPTSPGARGESESMPICVGRSNATERPVWPAVEQLPEARVRLGRGAEAGVLAHRPQAAAVHRRLDAARERELPRIAERFGVVAGHVAGPIDRRDGNAGRRTLRSAHAPKASGPAASHESRSRLAIHASRFRAVTRSRHASAQHSRAV